MDLEQLLYKLYQHGIKVWVDQGQLRYKCAPKAMTPSIKEDLVACKEDLIAFLQTININSRPQDRISPVPRGTLIPLSYAQKWLWMLDQFEQQKYVNNEVGAILLTGPLQPDVLERCIGQIIKRHEILRTNFKEVEGFPVQIIRESLALKLLETDLLTFTEDIRMQLFYKIATEEASISFNLETDPLMRIRLIKLKEERHILLFVMHHIIGDAGSTNLMLQEIAGLYQAVVSGKSDLLTKLPVQYADYAVWQQKWEHEEVFRKQAVYWRQKLVGEHKSILLHDYVEDGFEKKAIANHCVLKLDAVLSEQLHSFCIEEQVTLFISLFAIFNLLLYRYTRQEVLLVGFPFEIRQHQETEFLIGLFINQLILRTDISELQDFRSLLAKTKSSITEAYENSLYPYLNIMEELQLPKINVFFNMLNFDDRMLQAANVRMSRLQLPKFVARFDLNLYVKQEKGNIQLELVFNENLFSCDWARSFLENFRFILEQVTHEASQPLISYTLLHATSKQVLPNPIDNLEKEWEMSVVDQVELQADRSTSKIAMIDASRSWTYKQLVQESDSLAQQLLIAGVQSQDVIALFGERSGELVIAVLATLKAGGTFVILDSTYPEERLIRCLELAHCKFWVNATNRDACSHELSNYFEQKTIHQISRTNRSAPIKLERKLIEPDQIAYLQFTSGSTGQPKGVKHPHRPLAAFLNWQRTTFELGANDRFSMLSGLSHDPIMRDIFAPLCLGATLCIPEQQVLKQPGLLAEWMYEHQITVSHLTPGMIQVMGQTVIESVEVKSLRWAFVGGDRLSSKTVDSICKIASNVRVVNFYGMTETPQAVAYFVIDKKESGNIPVGRGRRGVQLLILNKSMKQCGIGELGDLYVRTPYLSAGYLDAERTQEQFLSNPFTDDPEDLMYKTGDLARYRADGNVEFMGRSDRQVKIRGYRVDLTGLEAVAASHPAVLQVVVVVENRRGEPSLTGFYLLKEGEHMTGENLQTYMTRILPEYMVPDFFMQVESFSLTPNGKVDTTLLLQTLEDTHRNSYQAPLTEMEQLLASIWKDLLGRELIGRKDHFFRLGGNSIKALQLVSRLVKLHFSLDFNTVFEFPILSELAIILGTAGLKCPGKENSQIRLSEPDQKIIFKWLEEEPDLEAVYPLSAMQESVFSQNLLILNGKSQASQLIMRIEGDFYPKKFSQAWDIILQRHPILRSNFRWRRISKPVQLVYRNANNPAEFLDISHMNEPNLELEEILAEGKELVFKVTDYPLVKLQIIHVRDQIHHITITYLNSLFDGWSLQNLIQDLQTAYRQLTENSSVEFEEIGSYSEYIRYWQGIDQKQAQQFWKSHLMGYLTVPGGSASSGFLDTEYQLKRQTMSIGVAEYDKLVEFAQQNGITLFTLLLAGWSLCFKKPDALFSFSTAGRPGSLHGSERMIGLFTNILPVRLTWTKNDFLQDWLRKVHRTVIDVMKHDWVSTEQIAAWSVLGREKIQKAIYERSLVFLNFTEEQRYEPWLQIQAVSTNARVPLRCYVYQGEGLNIAINYNGVKYSDKEISLILNTMIRFLKVIPSEASYRVEEFIQKSENLI